MKQKLISKCIFFIFIYLFSFLSINVDVYAKDNCIETVDLCNKIEKYWWGYRRYISNDQISKFSSKFDSMAAEFSFLGGLSLPIGILNPFAGVLVSGILEISSSYCWLVSTYIIKINNGNGVIIDFNNGIIFKITAI